MRASLNHTYRLVWSDVHSAWIAVSENSKARGKGGRVRAVAAAVAAAVSLMAGPSAYAAVCNGGSPVTTAFSVTTAATGPCQLGSGGSLSISNTGSITNPTANNTSYTVYATGITAAAGITNNGSISAAQGGGIEYKGSTIGGGITNAGTIAGHNGNGIWLTGSSLAGGITNQAGGTISSGNNGIMLNYSTVTGLISNDGTITGMGGGIHLNAATGGGPIGSTIGGLSNSGTITGGSTGINIASNSAVSGSITNSGTIAGTQYTGISLTASAVTGGVTNSGTIEGGVAGLHIKSGSAVSNGITNNGLIAATDTSSPYYERAIYLAGATITGGISNTSAISATNASAGEAIYLKSSSTINGGINNSGTIAGGYAGIHLLSGTTVSGLIDSSTISGGQYAVLVDGTSSLPTIDISGSSARFIGDVSAQNSAVTVDAGAIFANDNAFNVNSFTVADGGTFNFGAGTSSAGGTAGITVASGFTNAGTLAVADGVAAAITGNYTQSSTGVLQVGASSASSYGKLTVTGTASLPASAKLGVNVATANTLAVGDVLHGVLTAGSLNASTFVVTDNSSMFNFAASINGNAIDLTTLTGVTATSSVNATGNTVATGLATLIDGIVDGSVTSTGTSGLVTALGQLGTKQQVSQALNQLLPLLEGSTDNAVQNVVADIKHVIESEDGGIASGDRYLSDRHIWVKPFGSHAKQSDRNSVSGYKADTGGLVIGADGELPGGNRLGVAFSYAHSKVDSNSTTAPQNAGIDTYQVTLYGNHRLSGSDSLDYELDIGSHETHGQRFIPLLGLAANSRYNSTSLHAGAGWKHAMVLNDATTLTPTVRADYTTVHDDGYSESGAGASDLNVGSRGTEQFIISGGGRISHALDNTTRLTARAGIGYDLINKQASVTAAMAGAPTAAFTTYGLKPSPWLGTVGLGVEHVTGTGVKVIGRYDAEMRSGLLNQTLSVKVRWAF